MLDPASTAWRFRLRRGDDFVLRATTALKLAINEDLAPRVHGQRQAFRVDPFGEPPVLCVWDRRRRSQPQGDGSCPPGRWVPWRRRGRVGRGLYRLSVEPRCPGLSDSLAFATALPAAESAVFSAATHAPMTASDRRPGRAPTAVAQPEAFGLVAHSRVVDQVADFGGDLMGRSRLACRPSCCALGPAQTRAT